jgi:AraC-like DNA-binding protein
MFYESKHSLNSETFKLESGVDFSFPAHLHSAIELIYVTEGDMTVYVDNIQYDLTPGNAVLVFPNQVHSLHTSHHSRHELCIFSSKLVRAYEPIQNGKIPAYNLFTPDANVIQTLFKLTADQTLLIKGSLYSLCGQFNATAKYNDCKANPQDLLSQIFRFVEENYTADSSLTALSQKTGYHSVYLSRYFHQCTGITYSEYVTRSRINETAYLLKNTDKKMIDIAFSCGFNSLRSFNRSFQSVMGMTPTEYRSAK